MSLSKLQKHIIVGIKMSKLPENMAVSAMLLLQTDAAQWSMANFLDGWTKEHGEFPPPQKVMDALNVILEEFPPKDGE